MAKAQMEVMGLVIVVILLTLGLLLVVQFVVLKPQSQTKVRQESSQLAANLVSSMLESTTLCNNYQLRSLIQNCATKNDIICKDGAVEYNSCKYANRTIHLMLKKTLMNWSMSFNFTVSGTKQNFGMDIAVVRGDCSGEKEAKFSPIQAGGKTLIVDLEICR
jgi:hypothetical protein